MRFGSRSRRSSIVAVCWRTGRGIETGHKYERRCTDIRSTESTNEKILGLGFALIGLGATAGIFQKVAPIFFVLPIAVVGIIACAAVCYLCIYSMGGYKRHLEDCINARAGETILVWEQLVPFRERTASTAMCSA